jgi:predicted SnoaL-like aldol condensation-catalyzing enzyme
MNAYPRRATISEPTRRRISADIVRMENGWLAEQWDVPQDEATKQDSKSGKPMFRERFPA